MFGFLDHMKGMQSSCDVGGGFWGCFLIFIGFRGKVDEIWQSSTCLHVQEALYHIAKLEFGQLAVKLQRLHSCLNR